MANQVSPPDISFVNKRRAVAGSDAQNTALLSANSIYDTESTLDAELIAEGYTQAQIDKMNQNDKIYAVRVENDSDTI